MEQKEGDFLAEYSGYTRKEKLKYWERYFYWDFKNSYIENEIDHFHIETLENMRKIDPNFSDIQEDVIQNFVNFICGNDETLRELKFKLKLDD